MAYIFVAVATLVPVVEPSKFVLCIQSTKHKRQGKTLRRAGYGKQRRKRCVVNTAFCNVCKLQNPFGSVAIFGGPNTRESAINEARDFAAFLS